MDDVGRPTWTQVVRTFAVLRWALFRGAVRRGGSEQVGAIVSLVVAAVVGGVGGIGLAIAGRTTTDPVGLAVTACSAITAAVVGFGIVAGVTQSVDPRVIAAEPIDDRRRAVGVLVAAAVGPAGLVGIAMCVALGIGVVRTIDRIPVIAIGLLIWGASLLVVARTATNLLGLLVARTPRLGQFVVGVCGLALGLGVHLVPNLITELDDQARSQVVSAAAITPPGALGAMIADHGDIGSTLARLGVGTAWLGLLVWLFARSERRLVAAVRHTESRTHHRRSGRPTRIVRRWCGGGPRGAIAWQSLLLRFRRPRTALETVLGAALGLAAALAPAAFDDDPGAGTVLIGGAVQLAVLFMAGNSFGADGPGTVHDLLAGCAVADLVDGKRRSVVVVAAPVAVLGPLIAATISGAWSHLFAGWCVATGALLAGTGAAVLQSVTVPIAVPDSDNPFATGDSGSGLAAAVFVAAVLTGLAVVTLPVALLLLWASGTGLVTVVAVVTIGIGWATGRLGRALAIRHLSRREPEFLLALSPSR